MTSLVVCGLYIVYLSVYVMISLDVIIIFFFSSRRRHTRCALVTGVQTCALPISHSNRTAGTALRWEQLQSNHVENCVLFLPNLLLVDEIGRASCRERVCQYV